MWATCRSERNWCWACARSILGEHELNGWLRLANITPPLEYGANPKRPRQRVRPWQMNQLRWFTEWKGCFGGCRGRGTCVVGVCVCERGASGLDCAEGPPPPPPLPPPPPPRRTLAVYVYDLPADLGLTSFALRVWSTWFSEAHSVYSTEWRFLEYLLADSVRTLDPEQADLFFIPTLGALGGMPKAAGTKRCVERGRLELAIRHVRSQHPYWDRSGGRDHVVFLTGDQGGCGLGAAGTRPIIISAWGLIGEARHMAEFARRAEFERAEPSALAATLASGRWCHAPHKDVVVPPYGDVQLAGNESAGAPHWPPAEHVLLHVGGVWGANNHGVRNYSFYSQGMRQDLFFRYADERGRALGFIVRNRSMAHGKLSRLVKTSKFCFSPSGHGWGMRTGKNTMIGCVPLVAQPFVVQAFETELAFEEFSRRVDFEDMPTLAQKLEVGDAELLRLRLEGHRVRRTFMWHAEVGGLAYNFTILSLCHRAVELWGGLRAGPAASCEPLAAPLPGARGTRRMPYWYPPPLAEATRRLIDARRQGAAASQRLAWERQPTLIKQPAKLPTDASPYEPCAPGVPPALCAV